MGTYQRDCSNKVTLSIYINNMISSPTWIQTWNINGTFSVTTKNKYQWYSDATPRSSWLCGHFFSASMSTFLRRAAVQVIRSFLSSCLPAKETFQGVTVEGCHIQSQDIGKQWGGKFKKWTCRYPTSRQKLPTSVRRQGQTWVLSFCVTLTATLHSQL